MTWLGDIWARSGKQMRRLAGFLAAALVIGFGVEWIATSNARMIAVQPMAVNDIALSPDGDVLAIAYANGDVELRETGHRRKLIRRFGSQLAPVMDLHLDNATEAGLRLTMARADGRLVIETAIEGTPLSDDITIQPSLLTPQYKVAEDGTVWVHGVAENGPWMGRLEPGGNYAQPLIVGSSSSANMKLLSATPLRAHLVTGDQHTIWGLEPSTSGDGTGGRVTIQERIPLGEGYITLQDGHVMSAVNGTWRTAAETFIEEERGRASFYSDSLSGNATASGEAYDPEALTAAHRTLPFGSRILVTNEDTDLSVELRVNDRGPFTEDRMLDVSSAAARALGFETSGMANVRIKYLGLVSRAIGGATLETRQLQTGATTLSVSAEDEITSLDYSPDGTLMAAGNASGLIEIWQAATGTRLITRTMTNAEVLHVKFSPDGSKLLGVDASSKISVWETSNWSELASTDSRVRRTYDAAFSNTGDLIAIGTTVSTVIIYDAESLAPMTELAGHTLAVGSVAFSSDDQWLVAGGEDGTIRIWDIPTGEERLVIPSNGSRVTRVMLTPDDQYVLAATASGTVAAWTAETGALVFAVERGDPSAGSPVADLDTIFSDDGQALLSFGSGNGIVEVFDIRWDGTGRLVANGALSGALAAFSPTNDTVIATDGADIATIWTELLPSTWVPARSDLPCTSEDGVAFIEQFPLMEAETLWMWNKENGLCGVSLFDDAPPLTLPLPNDTTVVEMINEPDESWLSSLLIGRANGTVEHRSNLYSDRSTIYRGHGGAVTHIELARRASGLRAAIAATDGSVQILDIPARTGSRFARMNTEMGRAVAGANAARVNLINAIVPADRPPVQRRIQNRYELRDPLAGLQWNLQSPSQVRGGAGFVDYWAETGNIGSPEVVVAFIDTGVDFSHPSLQGANILPGWDMVSDIDVANDGDGRDSDPNDPGDICPDRNIFSNTFHGTHTLGSVASPHDDDGIAGYAPNVSFVPVRSVGKCGSKLSDMNDGIRWAAGTIPEFDELGYEVWNEYPADIIAVPIGLFKTCPLSLQDAINSVTEAGAIVVVAAGNRGVPTDFYAPAGCENIVSVAGADARGFVAPYSNYGAQVDLLAPGGNLARDDNNDGNPDGILSTKQSESCEDPRTGETSETCFYAFEQGSSMAIGSVVGALALLISEAPDLSRDEIVTKLLEQATRPVPDSHTVGLCAQYPGAAEYAEDPDYCLREVGGRILDLSQLHGGVPLAPIRDPRPSQNTNTPTEIADSVPTIDLPATPEETLPDTDETPISRTPPSTRLPTRSLPSTSIGPERESDAVEDDVPQDTSE